MADYAFEYLKSNKIRKMKIRLDIKYEYILLVYIIENAFTYQKDVWQICICNQVPKYEREQYFT
jgi:hypothetical protein